MEALGVGVVNALRSEDKSVALAAQGDGCLVIQVFEVGSRSGRGQSLRRIAGSGVLGNGDALGGVLAHLGEDLFPETVQNSFFDLVCIVRGYL